MKLHHNLLLCGAFLGAGFLSLATVSYAKEPLPVVDARLPVKLQPKLVIAQQADAVAFSPDGKVVAIGSVPDLAAQAKTTATANPQAPAVLQLAPHVVVRLWDTGTGQLIRELSPFETHLNSGWDGPLRIVFSPDGKTIAVASGNVQLWNAQEGAPLGTLRLPMQFNAVQYEQFITSLAFSSNSQQLVVGLYYGKGEVGIFDVSTRKQTAVLPTNEPFPFPSVPLTGDFIGLPWRNSSAVLSADGKLLATVGKEAKIWALP